MKILKFAKFLIKRALVVILFFILPSCSMMMPLLFGLQEIDGYNAEQCDKFYKKLPKDFAFTPIVCNDEQYFQVSELGADSMQMKDLYQPLKIMVFHGDSLVSFHINCKCPPTALFNLNWNYWHQFDEFPPATTVPLDGYTVTRNQLMTIFPEIKGDADYTVLVFWTNMLNKISRSEIKTVHKNLKKFGPSALRQASGTAGSGALDYSKVEVYLINDDITMTQSLNE